MYNHQRTLLANTVKSYSDLSLHQHLSNLFPICRSILGPGARQTLSYFESFHPELQRLIFKSGAKIFDWEVPLEWSINDAYIENLETGIRYASFTKSNLHVLGYSTAIDTILPLEELNDHLYSLPSQSERIPYVTSYYSRNWGFCISDTARSSLPDGLYRAFIDSSLEPGELHISHAVLNGSDRREIMFSTYICHPSMANNELSGPVILSALLDYVKTKYPKRRWTYRFILQPESIGCIAYLSRFRKHLKDNLLFGINLSCVGDEGPFSYIQTPNGDLLSDRVLASLLVGRSDVKTHTFLERGSDERQYCAPRINLDVATFTRSKFGTYPEYHTDADNLEFVTQEGLEGSLNSLITVIDALETCHTPLLTTLCEPQLGKRGLYPNISYTGDGVHPAQIRSDIIGYSNGKNTIFDVALKTQIPLKKVVEEVALLKKFHLIQDVSKPNIANALKLRLIRIITKLIK